ncbi:MAG TPA: hypothetical protein VLV16_00680 [Gemmatimonadales bacterium]|nr:hypothetical protein [Gemmatimonadales bacterium]
MRTANPARAGRSRQAGPGLALLVLLSVLGRAPLAGQADTLVEQGGMDTTDHSAAMAVHEAMSDLSVHDLHMRFTPARPGSAADSARAAALVVQMRNALGRYRDVRSAEADGFRQFLPQVPQAIAHFTNWRYAVHAMFEFDPERPTSLLYRRRSDGSFELVGAMYTAPARTSEDALDARIPLGVARWHEHVNWCLPPRGARERWREVRDGAPVFGPRSPIATREACDAVGGRFRERIFGWMVHVNAFASDDPKVIWSVEHGAGGLGEAGR